MNTEPFLGNTSGLTNKELLISALEALVREVESGLVAQPTLERARYALASVRRPKKPKSDAAP